MPKLDRRRALLALGATLPLAGLLAAPAACKKDPGPALARQITNRADLIGGPGALGEVGDYLLQNDQIRLIIQGEGFSRGFGIYGGGLIDADLVRPDAAGSSAGGDGFDNFSEMFPGLFLRAMRPRAGGIETKQNDDGSASVIVNGAPAEFLFLTQRINDIFVGSNCSRDVTDDCVQLSFKQEYILRPGKRWVEILLTVTNSGQSDVDFPGDAVGALTGGLEFPLPVGDVLLFGAGNRVFSPGLGFNLRFGLEAIFRDPPPLPQFPGLVTPFIASASDDVSYGFASGIEDEDVSFVKRVGYPDARTDDLLIPFVFSAFTGAFFGAAPKSLEPRESFQIKRYFIVGGGDVASVRDAVHELRGWQSGTFAGLVRERETRAPEAGAEIVTFDAKGRPYSHHRADARGQFRGLYEPGQYSYVVSSDGRFPTERIPFEVKAGATTAVEIELPSPGAVSVSLRAEDGRPIPGKCSLVAVHGLVDPKALPRDYLFDLRIGERRRYTDLVTNGADPASREFLEEVVMVGAEGTRSQLVRPGKYKAVCSRGIEYELYEQAIEVKAGGITQISGVLKRAFDTTGWASGDYHLHQVNSVDSFLPLDDRVRACAAEGLDIALSSDHNFVTDFGPTIASEGLEGWLQGMVGLELTTLEIGHFNGFPLRYDPGPITKGSFEWSGRVPTELMTDLRGLGKYGPERTIVQVNHPRDTILGYFNQYNWNPDRGRPEESTGLILVAEGPEFGPDKFDLERFDAMEIFNGKRFELLRTYRIPEVLPPGPLPEDIPPAGTILRDERGKVAFPGGVEDWFVLLNQGVRKTAMGNSDSHDDEEEPGSPRTYVPVTNDRPGEIDELEVVRAIQQGKAIATNGPFVLVEVGGKGMGETADGSSGQVTLKAQIRTASWAGVDRVNVIVNGELIRTETGDRASLAQLEYTLPVTRDAWVVLEVSGSQSHFPVVVPHEVPSLQISDAVGGIAGAFGIQLNAFGALQPNQVQAVTSYALTNPVFIDADGNGKYDPPGIARQALLAEQAPRVKAEKPDLRALPSLVKVFAAFGHH